MSSPDAPGSRGPGGNMGGGGNNPRTRPDDPIGRPGGKPPGGGSGGGPKDPCRPADYIYDPVTGSMVPPPGCPGAPSPTPDPTPTPPPPMFKDPIYIDSPSVTIPKVKTGIISDQYAKLLDVPYRQAFMPGGPDQSIFAAKNVMPVETKADPRPYSRTKQIPIRDLYTMKMRDATDAELMAVETGPDKPLMSTDPYKMMSYELDYMAAPGSTFTGPGTKPPGPITGPIIPLPIVGPTPIKKPPKGGGGGGGSFPFPIVPSPINPIPKPISGGIFTPSPGGGGGGTYTGPGVNLPGPVIPLPGVGKPPSTGGNLIPLSNELGFTIDNEGNVIYSDSEGNPMIPNEERVGKMDGGMMIIEDGVANDGIGGILKKYKEIRSEL